MRAPPTLRGGLRLRLGLLGVGLVLFASGIVAMYESRLGLPPWDVLHQGIAEHSPLSFGDASVAVSIVIVVLAWRLGARIGVGTLANALGVGLLIVALTALGPVEGLAHDSVPVRAGLLLAGLALMGVGSGLYLGAALGAGPRDSLMVVGAARTPFRIGLVRGGIELCALLLGILLGGTVGVGTVAFVILIGPAIESSFWLLERSPLARPSPATLEE
jgi:uncharacterized membrane protein YczE